MSTAKRAPTLSSVLLFVLLNGVPSEGQSVVSAAWINFRHVLTSRITLIIRSPVCGVAY